MCFQRLALKWSALQWSWLSWAPIGDCHNRRFESWRFCQDSGLGVVSTDISSRGFVWSSAGMDSSQRNVVPQMFVIGDAMLETASYSPCGHHVWTLLWYGRCHRQRSGHFDRRVANTITQWRVLHRPGSLGSCFATVQCRILDPIGMQRWPMPLTRMERTYEAPSHEAPHMILGYHQGRLVTYLQFFRCNGKGLSQEPQQPQCHISHLHGRRNLSLFSMLFYLIVHGGNFIRWNFDRDSGCLFSVLYLNAFLVVIVFSECLPLLE